MVKLDLERVGIPYLTPDGVADFHAAGRHIYITELLRSGASLVEARELARHSDVRMTMKYTHIGVDDQAQAIAKPPGLRATPAASTETASTSPEPEPWPRPGHDSAVSACQNTSTNGGSRVWGSANKNPCVTGVIAKRRRVSLMDTSGGGGNRMRGRFLPTIFPQTT